MPLGRLLRAPAIAVALICVPSSALAGIPTTRFVTTTWRHTFGQAPAFMPDGRIVVGEDLGGGDGQQIYISKLDGSKRRCLTCGQAGPNGVPQPRPQGDWILYHSWTGEYITLGSPGFGGIGSQLWVMHPDGTHRTALTGTNPANGGEGEDNYHAYWSPDGNRLVWAHFNGNFVNNNGTNKWDITVARFVVKKRKPSLTDLRVVRPANGHWYETHWWAPDGSGFLYTETWGSAMNTELFFCRLTSRGCAVTRLTDNAAWDEQAIFTPDSKHVIFMSSRDRPGFYNTFSTLAADAGLPTDYDNYLVLPVFEAGFLQPVAQETTDLYDLDLATSSVRRLTHDGDDGWVIPEFTWDPKNQYLFWTELRIPDGLRVPLPLDASRQLAQTQRYVGDPVLPGVGFNRLQLVPVEKRTRIGRFAR